jgi:HK97 family phage major capsid protein
MPQNGSPAMAFTAKTTNSAGAWRPDGYAFQPGDVLPDALYLTCTTKAGVIEGDEPVVRVAWIDDALATFVGEGIEIPESQPTLAEVLVASGKVSELVRLSREQFVQEGTAAQLSQSVARAVQRRADLAFVQQVAPTPPALGPSTGLAHIAGIVDGGEIVDNLDVLVDLVAQLQENASTPSQILLSPTAWAAFRKLKVGGVDTNSSLIGAGTDDAQPRLLGLPVTVSLAVPTLTGFVIDKTAVVSAYGEVQVNTSDHQYFTADSVAVRCTWRVGHNVVRPNRIGMFTIEQPGS